MQRVRKPVVPTKPVRKASANGKIAKAAGQAAFARPQAECSDSSATLIQQGGGTCAVGNERKPARRGSSLNLVFQKPAAEQIRLSRHGLPATAVDAMAERLGLSRAQYAGAVALKLATIERHRREARPLSPVATDRIYRTEKVLARAQEVLEDATGATQWLLQPLRSLGGVSPLSLLDTHAGVDLVMATLGRIEDGIVA